MPYLAVRCRDLRKRYADVVAVDGLSLEVSRGECFGLLGPNGAGKTTTIEILEGLIAPDGGDVEVLGHRWATDERELRQRLGIQLQETQMHDKLTVEETLRLFRSFYDRGPSVNENGRHSARASRPAPTSPSSSAASTSRRALPIVLLPHLTRERDDPTGMSRSSRWPPTVLVITRISWCWSPTGSTSLAPMASCATSAGGTWSGAAATTMPSKGA